MAEDAGALAAARYARLQAAMARHGVGCVLLATPHLAAAASGARRVQVGGSGGVLPWVVIAAGAPAAVVFTTDPDGVPPRMPRSHVRPLLWDRDRQFGEIARLVAATRGAVALDVLCLPLEPLVAGRSLMDAAPLLAEAAAGRTPGEVEATRRALRAARDGAQAAQRALRPGVRPMDLVAAGVGTMSAHGAGFPLGEGLWWRAGMACVRLAPDEALAASDVLALEWGVYAGGQAGVAGTTARADGGALAEPRGRWDLALCALAKRCRAGTTAAELATTARETGAAQLGLLAHGLGVGIEPPYVDLDHPDAEPLRSGTVLVLAPVVSVDGQQFRATRALLVTEGAHRWLEEAP